MAIATLNNKKNKQRFKDMKQGQLAEICNNPDYKEYDGLIVVKAVGDEVFDISSGDSWTELEQNHLNIRILDVGESVTLTQE